MQQELLILLFSALAVGFIHTLMGPDHYLPFIVMARARQWSRTRTFTITTFCGIGHVASAMILGLIAASLGLTLHKLNFLEAWRGSFAAWLLIGFGFAYFLWGVRQAIKNKEHTHPHFHVDGSIHQHTHNHHKEHAHVHAQKSPQKSLRELTPWILFVIFILGPCEPLIPLIIYPALKGQSLTVFLITLFFGIATLTVMLSIVAVALFGMRFLQFNFLRRYGNVLAGSVICCSGLAIKFLGL
jgi:sulfite exporter TauE/SafE